MWQVRNCTGADEIKETQAVTIHYPYVERHLMQLLVDNTGEDAESNCLSDCRSTGSHETSQTVETERGRTLLE